MTKFEAFDYVKCLQTNFSKYLLCIMELSKVVMVADEMFQFCYAVIVCKLYSSVALFGFKLLIMVVLYRNISTMLIQKSNSVSSILPFSSSAIDNLWRAGQELNGTSIAGVSAGNLDRYCAYCYLAVMLGTQ